MDEQKPVHKCDACEDTGYIHEYAGMGAYFKRRCPLCNPKDEDEIEKEDW